LALVIVLQTLPGVVAGEETDTPSLAADPRVSDAVAVWAEWVEYQLGINAVPGASVAVVYDQELLFVEGFGLANPETGQVAAPDTIYSICSNSKLFTAIAVMQLRDAGMLRLDDPLDKHLEWFAIEDIHPNDETITIRRILTHSSGLPRESDYPYWSGPDYLFPTHEQIVERIADQKTLYPSGRYYQYSNLGLTLAGEIVAAASGRSYDEYVKAEILDPLGMSDTFTEIPAGYHGGRLAIGHTARNRDGSRDPMPLFQSRGIAPAAGFASTAEDMARFGSWQLRLRGQGGIEVLRAATLREMQRVHWVDPDWKTTYGLGFYVARVGESTLIEHGGSCPGYYSQVAIEPKSKLGVVVLSNAIGTEVDLYVEQAVALIGPAVKAARDDRDGLSERDPELDRYVGVYDSDWGQEAIVRWEDGLAMLSLGTRNPVKGLEKLKKTGEHSFRRVRKDDESLGETVVFEVDEHGVVTRFLQHSNWAVKVR
jgi:CubicO group peptidase (beta-lactamase class C family)